MISLPPPTQNTTYNTWPTVMDVTDNVTDNVTDESLAGDECDECDGYFSTQSENLNLEKKIRSNNTTAINKENFPSHPSRNVSESIGGDELQPISNPSQQPSRPVTPSVTEPIKNSTQENLFSKPQPEEEIIEYDFNDITADPELQ